MVVIESVVLPEVFNDGGLNVEVVPVGNPFTIKLTVPE